jgi:hypothetical protein
VNGFATRHANYGLGRVGFGDAASDLGVFDTFVARGDASLGAGDYPTAVIAYQVAGQNGATQIGPEIDAQTGGASQPLTNQAWSINTNLAAVNNGTNAASGNPTGSVLPGQADAQQAQGFVRQMQNLYHQAISTPPAGPMATPSSRLASAAQTLVQWLQTNGCSTSSIGEVTTFQTIYNTEGQSTLTVDGKYGPATQAALQRVLDVSGGGAAPTNCFPRGGPSPVPGGGGTVIPTTPIARGLPWGTIAVAGAAVAGAGLIAYAVHKKKGGKGVMHHARRMGHHMRHHVRGMRHRLVHRRA